MQCQNNKTTDKTMKKITTAITFAKRTTEKAATMADYKVRNRKNRMMREIARDLNRGRGYVIASAVEMSDAGELIAHNNGRRIIWAVGYNNFYKELQFIPIR